MDGTAAEAIRVLHVEDDPDVADVTASFLDRAEDRFTVVSAPTPADALDRLADDGRIDCVVSDYDMPGMDGLAFLRAVREDYPSLPFILFTGKGSEEIASEAIAAGVTDYLQKQQGTEQYALLANRIGNAVDQYRASQRARTLERVREIAYDVDQALVRAESRADVESGVCEIITAYQPYLFAVIGSVDRASGRVRIRASRGAGGNAVAGRAVDVDDLDLGAGLVRAALRDRTVTVEQEMTPPSAAADGDGAGLPVSDVRSTAAVPLHRDDDTDVLVVYSDRPCVFDETERAMLEDLGADIVFAMESLETREELREIKAFNEELIEHAPVGLIRLDDDFRISFENPHLQRIIGLPEEKDRSDAIGVDIRDLPSVVEAGLVDEIERLAEGESIEIEFSFESIYGREAYLWGRGVPLYTEGEFDGAILLLSDITERHERERDLELYETIVETAGDAVYVLDSDGRFQMVNEELCERNGYAREDLIGEHVSILLDEESIDRAETAIRDLLESGGQDIAEFEATTTTADGAAIPIEIRAAQLVDDDGSFRGTIGVSRDITERKERERALQRQNERLDEFASVVSHDLRNPLNVATGRLALAMDECDSEHLADMERALDRMDGLIENMLQWARDGQAVTEPTTVDLAAFAESCWANVRTDSATLSIESEITIRCDDTRFQQFLENLFRNAIDHAGPDVEVVVGALQDGFFVEDDGPGIPPEERDTVLESGYSTADEGAGFGLSIVEQIADAHEWTLAITDAPSGGARIEVTGVDRARSP